MRLNGSAGGFEQLDCLAEFEGSTNARVVDGFRQGVLADAGEASEGGRALPG